MNVRDGLSQRALGLDIAAAGLNPRLELRDNWSALSRSTLEALFERFVRALGLGIDVKDSREEFEPLERAGIADTQSCNQLATGVRVQPPRSPPQRSTKWFVADPSHITLASL